LSVAIKIPEVGESISEVAIGEWLKREGDFVERDQEVVVIETDKATVEIPAPESGRVTKILKQTGESASVNEVIAYIDDNAADDTAKPHNGAGQPEEAEKQSDAGSDELLEKDAAVQPHVDDNTRLTAASRKTNDGNAKVQPSAGSQPAPTSDSHKTTEEAGVLDALQSSNRQPVDEAARNFSTKLRPDLTPDKAQEKEPTTAAAQPKQSVVDLRRPGARPERTVPMSQLRRKIAERLVQAQQTAALLTTFNEIDMSAVMELRQKHHDAFAQKYETKLGFMSFFVKATIEALRLVPEMNAEIRGENVVYRNFFDIGIAVGGGKGLVVPVLRDAEKLGFGEIEKAIADFARRAQQNKLMPNELAGGTFTISNGGIYGSLFSTPIVNPPQSAILGLHAIQERPVAHQGAVVVRPMMYAALTYDHRLIDGREAVTCLKHIKDLIEEPARMLLEI
jgi:2-oxoglutarate dehydrogenase E2 component (dihydrolipoamide succinyltransferase)